MVVTIDNRLIFTFEMNLSNKGVTPSDELAQVSWS